MVGTQREGCFTARNQDVSSLLRFLSILFSGNYAIKSTEVYDPDSHQYLVDNGVYPNTNEYPDRSVFAKPDSLETLT